MWEDDDVVVNAALEDLSVPTASESDDQLVSMEFGEASNAVTHFVGDNIDLTIVYSRKHRLSFNRLKVTSPAPTPDPQTTAAVHRVKLKELDKVKILKWSEDSSIHQQETDRNKLHHVSSHRWALLLCDTQPVLPDPHDSFQPKGSWKPAQFDKNQPNSAKPMG